MEIQIDDVWSILREICSLDDSQKDENIVYCAYAQYEFSAILKEKFSDRAILACAILAFYYYCLMGEQENLNDVSFEAGDVSVKYNARKTDVEYLRKLAYEYARDDIERDMEFTFRAV